MIDAYASQAHYLAHVLPVMAALPDAYRGAVYVPRAEWTASGAVSVSIVKGRPPPSDAPALVAAGRDIKAVTRRPVALMEHGVGQSYDGSPDWPVHSNGYAGGVGRERVTLFICPNQTVRNANHAHYPNARYAVVGMPKLDAYAHRHWPRHRVPVVAFSFHWPCRLIPEAGTCWPDYRDAIAELVANTRYEFLGHAHPRYERLLRPQWERLGVEYVADFAEVMERSDVFCADNSSCLYEFAATDRPVLTLSCSRYRRDVNHGLRFWEAIPGVECRGPDELAERLTETVIDPEVAQDLRRRAVRMTVGRPDGYASRRAAAALLDAR